MNSNLLFDFSVDRKSRTIHIKREFDADPELVWQAWTTAELLDQWCAPNPYRTETKTLDFKEGGFWHYALVSPDGARHWSWYSYKKIEPHKRIIEWRVFSDEQGTVDPDAAPTKCDIVFSSVAGKTLVTIIEKYGNSEMFERMGTDSHKKGFSSHLKNLDRLLFTLKKQES